MTLFSLFKMKETRWFMVAGFCVQSGVYGVTVVFAPYVQYLTGSYHSATWVGILQAVTWLSTMIASPWWGKRNDCKPVPYNFFWAALGCGLSIYLQVLVSSIYWLIVFRIMQGVCFASLLPSVLCQICRFSNDENRSTRIGLTNSMLVAGQMAGSMMGAGLGGYLGLSEVIVCMGSLFSLSACLVVLTGHVNLKARRIDFDS
jgi:MFS family permease